MLAIDVQDLRKRYGPVAALDGLTLQVPAGSIYGLLGVNGAGKTTLLRHGFLVTGRVEAAAVRAVPGVTGVQVYDLSLEEVFWSYVEE